MNATLRLPRSDALAVRRRACEQRLDLGQLLTQLCLVHTSPSSTDASTGVLPKPRTYAKVALDGGGRRVGRARNHNTFRGSTTCPAEQVPTFGVNKTKYLSAFRPDACNSTPCPRASRSGDGSLPDSELPCPSNPPNQKCQFFPDNAIQLSPGAQTAQFAFASATIGLRWCFCPGFGPFGGDTTTPGGRIDCANPALAFMPCSYDPAEFTKPNSPWLKLWTGPNSGQAWSGHGAQDQQFKIAPIELLAQGQVLASTSWNFMYGDVAAHTMSLPGASGGSVISVAGVLWANVRAYGGPTTTFPIPDFASFYTDGSAKLTVVPLPMPPGSGGKVPSIPMPKFPGPLPAPGGFSQFASQYAIQQGDPAVYVATDTGLQVVRNAPASLHDLLAGIAAGTTQFVPAAEPMLLQDLILLPQDHRLRGVMLNGTSVAGRVEMTSYDATPAPVSSTCSPLGGTCNTTADCCTGGCCGGVCCDPPAPALLGNEGVALSALFERLYVIGGTVNGSADGTPNPSAWFMDLRNSVWVEIPLAAEQRAGEVLGATVRYEDFSVYVADRIDDTSRIRRWTPPDAPVTELAQLPDTWSGFDRTWLVVGARGDLLYAATLSDDQEGDDKHKGEHGHGKSSHENGHGGYKTLYARFTVGPDQKLVFAGLKLDHRRILSAPILGPTGIAIVVPDDDLGAVLRTILLDELEAPAPDFEPTIE